MSKIVFIDVQGFRGNSNNFIVKEIAIVFNANEFINFIIKPPFEYKYLSSDKQKQVNWLTKNHHHLQWEAGSVTFRSVCKFIKANTMDSCVYVKGVEKKKWIEEILHKKVFNIENMNCSNLKNLEKQFPECIRYNCHNHGICALQNAHLLLKFFNFNKTRNINSFHNLY